MARLTEPLVIGNVILANRVFGAPMSGVSDFPYRKRVLLHGAAASVAEMTPAARLIGTKRHTPQRRAAPSGTVNIVQLASRNPAALAEAAQICAEEGADIIDINFGCPAKKVTGGYAGSALMREPDLAAQLVEAAVKAVDVPITVKMRLGWEVGQQNASEIARLSVEAGAQMITVHGRTRCQFYTGQADWNAIAAVRDAIKIPLIVNGDITSPETALAALNASGADAIMIGRGCYGSPWLPGEIARLAGDAKSGGFIPKTRLEIFDYVIAHHEETLLLYGFEQGIRHARKHLGWYLDKFAPATDVALRSRILTSLDIAEIQAGLQAAFVETQMVAAA
ncbi:MAG: tRNA dihydrouridine synthase DusB [Notoacmeibacter sp.]